MGSKRSTKRIFLVSFSGRHHSSLSASLLSFSSKAKIGTTLRYCWSTVEPCNMVFLALLLRELQKWFYEMDAPKTRNVLVRVIIGCEDDFAEMVKVLCRGRCGRNVLLIGFSDAMKRSSEMSHVPAKTFASLICTKPWSGSSLIILAQMLVP